MVVCTFIIICVVFIVVGVCIVVVFAATAATGAELEHRVVPRCGRMLRRESARVRVTADQDPAPRGCVLATRSCVEINGLKCDAAANNVE